MKKNNRNSLSSTKEDDDDEILVAINHEAILPKVKQVDEIISPAFAYHKDNPPISDSVIADLPDVIKSIAVMYTDHRERDVFITSMLTLFSGCFHNVKGIYKRREFQPNLFAFIVAPPASGKGALNDAKNIFKLLHSKRMKLSKALLAKYHTESKKKANKEDADEELSRPPFKMLFIPANITTSKLYHILQDCDGAGIIIETEADVLAKMLKHEIGDTSSVLRCSFQNEDITFSRVGDSIHIEIERPKVAILLSGTPNQVPGIINSTANGLFSRFLYYAYYKPPHWDNVFPDKEINRFPSMIGVCANEVVNMIEEINQQELTIRLSESQKRQHNKHFSSKLEEITCFSTEEASSILFRIALMAFKIMMTLTAIRKYDEKLEGNEIECCDRDFKVALQLTDIYVEHSLAMLKTLPSGNSEVLDNKAMKLFLDILPINRNFGRTDSIHIAKKHGLKISDKTVYNYLARLLSHGYITKDGYNEYRKINKK